MKYPEKKNNIKQKKDKQQQQTQTNKQINRKTEKHNYKNVTITTRRNPQTYTRSRARYSPYHILNKDPIWLLLR